MTKISNQYSLTNILTADLANSRLGINNVSPTVALDVTGTAKATTFTDGFITIGSAQINRTSATVEMQFNSSGNVRFFGAGSSPITFISSTGAATFSSSVTAATKFISSAGNNNIVFESLSATTGYQYIQLLNTTAHTIFGIEGTTAGSLLTGGLAYGSVFTSVGNTALQLGTNQTARLTITSSGNVGIGTTSPSQPLHVYATSTTTSSFFETNSTNSYIGLKSTSGTCYVGNVSYAMTFEAGGSERMRITSAGNVGIGTTSPAEKLSVLGTISVMTTSNAPTNSFVRLGTFSNGSWGSYVSAGTNYNAELATTLKLGTTDSGGNGTDRMTISTNGSIGAPSGTNIYNASDARLKKNISTTTYGLDTISALNPVKFNWVDGFEPNEDGKDMLGFIAQEVQQVIPEAIESFGENSITIGNTEIDNPLRVNEKFIIPVLVKAIQELSAKVSLLENK